MKYYVRTVCDKCSRTEMHYLALNPGALETLRYSMSCLHCLMNVGDETTVGEAVPTHIGLERAGERILLWWWNDEL